MLVQNGKRVVTGSLCPAHDTIWDKGFCVCSVLNRMYFRHDFFFLLLQSLIPPVAMELHREHRAPYDWGLALGFTVLAVRSYFLVQEPRRTTFLLCQLSNPAISSSRDPVNQTALVGRGKILFRLQDWEARFLIVQMPMQSRN